MRELFHRANDSGDTLDTFQRLLDRFWNLCQKILNVGGFGGRFGGSDELRGNGAGTGGSQQTAMSFKVPFQIIEGVLQEARIITNVLGWSVDFVGNSGGELADGFELLRLVELGLQAAQGG